MALAGLRQPGNAFAHAEASLARGLLDDLAARSIEEVRRVEGLRARLEALEPVLASLAGRENLRDRQKDQHQSAGRECGRLSAVHSAVFAPGPLPGAHSTEHPRRQRPRPVGR